MRIVPALIPTVPPLSEVFCSACMCELKDVAYSKLTTDNKWCGWLCSEHHAEWEDAGRK